MKGKLRHWMRLNVGFRFVPKGQRKGILLAPLVGLFGMLLWLAGASSTVAQSADKILKQSVKTITKGAGEKALRRVTSWQATGTITRSRDGVVGRYQASAMHPDLYTFHWEIGGFETSSGFTGKSSWRRDSRDGLRTLTGDASDELLAEAWYRNRRWLDYKKDRAKLIYSGSDIVSGKATHALKLTNPRGIQIKLYFDVASGLLVKEELPAGE